jgi:predicted PurR-regulated permease PerM
MLASYIRAQFILAALTAVALTVGLGLMRVPYSFVLSPLAGLCEFIPVVGPAVACVAIFGIAAVTGYSHLLWLFLVLGAWRVIQDYVNAPRIMGRSVEISPLAEIFGVLAGGEIGGVVGALVAVPILALLRILWLRLSVQDAAATLPDTASVAPPVADTPTAITYPTRHIS